MASENITFHNVSTAAFEALQHRLHEHYDGAQDGDALQVLGVRGTLSYDEESASVTAHIHQVPAIVSRGYVVGWLCDALVEAAG